MRVLRDRLAGVRKHLALIRARHAGRGAPARIAYVGGEGHGNLGDDAMFEAARELLGDAAVLSFDRPVRERRLARVRLAGRRYFQAAILGGGTLINPLWRDRTRLAVDQGLPAWTLGTGVGSCGFVQPREVELGDWVPILRRFRRLGVRGPRSRRALDALGIEGAEVVGDLALALAFDAPLQPAVPPRLAINVYLPWTDRWQPEEHAPLRALVRAVRDLVAAGWRTVPVAMNWEDLPTLRWLTGKVSGAEAAIVSPDGVRDFFDSVRPCVFSIAVRLHAAVLSCCAGVPPLMLGYRDKCLDFMESMGLEEWYVDLETSDPRTVAAKVQRLAVAAPALREPTLERARHWQGRLRTYARSLGGALAR